MIHNLDLFADAQITSDALRSSISPLFSNAITVATILCILFVAFGGYYYMTSVGNPEKLEHAKKTLRNAFLGFVIILGAGTLLAIMQNAYSSKPITPTQINIQNPKVEEDFGINDVVNEAIKGFIREIVESIGQPVLGALRQFTTATPLMAQNSSVFNLWIAMVAISNILFLLVIGLIGFRIMSTSVVGLEDVDIRSLIPQIVLAFIVANLSIFVIDAIITISNTMVHAFTIGMSNEIIWKAFGGLVTGLTAINVGVLILIFLAMILAVLLLIYYLKRMIILYIGAVLSPLVILVWLLPSFRDFATSSIKMYVTTIFTLFIQIVVLMLIVSIFSGLTQGESNQLITALLAIATLSVLLSANRTMNQLAILSASGHGMRKLGNTFIRSISYVTSSAKQTTALSRTMSNPIYSYTTQPRTATNTTQIRGMTRQVSLREAAHALTDKRGPTRDVVVSGGATRPNVNLTEQGIRKASRASKGGKR